MEAVIYFVGMVFMICIFYIIISVIEYSILKNQHCEDCDDITKCEKEDCDKNKRNIVIKRED